MGILKRNVSENVPLLGYFLYSCAKWQKTKSNYTFTVWQCERTNGKHKKPAWIFAISRKSCFPFIKCRRKQYLKHPPFTFTQSAICSMASVQI